MLQSAVIQDGGDAKETAQFTRLFAYNVSNLSVPPPLIGEWVVPLPSSDKGKVLACSEILFVKPGVFLALSRDGDGRGGDDNNSKYKYVPGNRFFSPIAKSRQLNTMHDFLGMPIYSPSPVQQISTAPNTMTPPIRSQKTAS